MQNHLHIQRTIIIIYLLGSITHPGRLSASDTLYVDRNFKQAHATTHAWIYEDKEHDEELQAILKRTFLEHSRPYLNFGFTKSAYWLKIVLKNTDDIPVEIYYQYLNHYLDFVDIFQVDQNDSLLSKGYFGARRLQPSYKSIKMNPVYDINLAPGRSIDLYLRIQSDTPLRIPVVFNSSDSLVKRERERYVFLA